MTACPKLTYAGVTASAWARIVELARVHGITATTAGSATESGFTAEWVWDPPSGTLVMQCTDSPVFVSCEVINAYIDSMVKGQLTTPDGG